MFKMIVVLLLAVTFSSTTFTSVVTEKVSCSSNEHKCSDGSCISLNSVCDGLLDCLDGSDEQKCTELNPLYDFIFNSNIHQAQTCRADDYKCSDGSCISLNSVCDGLLDCLDGSDEKMCTESNKHSSVSSPTFKSVVAEKDSCSSDEYKCSDGSCISLNSVCDGWLDCFDGSDEKMCTESREHKCDNGQVISTEKVCDGKSDCADGSDETLKSCAGNRCATYLFQCAYGACVDEGSNCNGTEECADGSDESDELCNRTSPGQPTSPIRPPIQGGKCVLPPYPINGTYTVNNNPAATPGKRYPSVKLQISCNSGFQVENNTNSIFCVNGDWSSIIPKCVHFCRLHKHPSVEYRCVLSGPGSLTGSRECGSLEPSGTVATPICKSPNYYSTELLTDMRCVEGTWDYIATCKPSSTNISIIMDDIEIVVTSNNAQVTVNNYDNNKVNIVNNFQNAQNIVIEHNRGRSSSSRTTTSTTTESNSVHDIDESYWRMGQAK